VIADNGIENLILAATCRCSSSSLLYRYHTKATSRNLLSRLQSTPTCPKSIFAIKLIIVAIHANLFLLVLSTFSQLGLRRPADESPHNRSPFLSVLILVDAQSVRSQEVELVPPFVFEPLLLGCSVRCGPFVDNVGRSACWHLSGCGVAWRGVLRYLCGVASGFMLILLRVGVTSG
jgi:hypothetical protein